MDSTLTQLSSTAQPAVSGAVARGSIWWAAWADLVNFRPPISIQAGLKSRNQSWYIQRLEDAAGDINLDLYRVVVSRLPNSFTAEQLLETVRTNINQFVDQSISKFVPYDDRYPPASALGGDKARWLSSNPQAAVISIDMNMFWTIGGYTLNPDDGSVICARREPNFWMFSTIYTDEDRAHPVSGNRQFGFIQDPKSGSYIFFTRGADRATGLIDDFPLTPVFSKADDLWRSFQGKLSDYVNSHGGSATCPEPISERVPWYVVKIVVWKPETPWL